MAILAAAIACAGCGSPRANPASPKPGRGYVDFHTRSAEPLSWEIERFDAKSGSFETVYSKFRPDPHEAIRFAFPPGRERLRVTFLNRLVAAPPALEVEVREGMVTPVEIAIAESGKVAVLTREFRYGGTYKGRWGRMTEFGDAEQAYYRLSGVIGEPLSYKKLELMPYYKSPK